LARGLQGFIVAVIYILQIAVGDGLAHPAFAAICGNYRDGQEIIGGTGKPVPYVGSAVYDYIPNVGK